MKEEREEKKEVLETNRMYDPITEEVVLKIYTDPLETEIEVNSNLADKGSAIFFFRVIEKIFPKREVKKEVKERKFVDLKINFITSSAEKLFKFLKLTMRKSFEIQKNYEEIQYDDGTEVNDKIEDVYIGLYASAMGINENDDEVIRHILDNKKLCDFDFIPYLTVDQRKKIIETFWKVNPMLKEADEKVGEQIRKRMEGIRS